MSALHALRPAARTEVVHVFADGDESAWLTVSTDSKKRTPLPPAKGTHPFVQALRIGRIKPLFGSEPAEQLARLAC